MVWIRQPGLSDVLQDSSQSIQQWSVHVISLNHLRNFSDIYGLYPS